MKNMLKKISDKIAPSKEPQEQRREKRVSVLKELTVEFNFKNGDVLNVINMSFNGLAFKAKTDTIYSPGDRIEGSLNVNGHHFHIEAHVRHFNKKLGLVGCHVENSDDNYMNRFLNEYKNELESQFSKRKGGKVERAGTPHWFLDNHCELFYIERKEKLVKIQVVYDREVLEFNQGKIFFGIADEKMDRQDVYFDGIEMLSQKRDIPTDFIEESIAFIRKLDAINEDHRAQIIEKLQKAST